MEPPTGFLEFSVRGMNYVVYLPKNAKSPCPAILFLHGRGESGHDGLKQVIQGVGSAVMWDRSRWPFLIIFPQKPDHDKLWPDYRKELNLILKSVEEGFDIDPHKRYITGLSQGGHGTYRLAGSLDWNFAAAAPICGWCDDDESLRKLHDIPVWAFHGDADTAVPVKGSQDAVAKIKQFGGDAKLTIFEGVDHNSWDKAYRETDLPTWLLSESL